MATNKARIQVYVDPPVARAYEHFASLVGVSLSSIVGDLMIDFMPALGDLGRLVESARRAKHEEQGKLLRKYALRQGERVDELISEVFEQTQKTS